MVVYVNVRMYNKLKQYIKDEKLFGMEYIVLPTFRFPDNTSMVVCKKLKKTRMNNDEILVLPGSPLS